MVLQRSRPATSAAQLIKSRKCSIAGAVLLLLSLVVLPGCSFFSELCPNNCWLRSNSGKCPPCEGRGTVRRPAAKGWVICSQCGGDSRMACPFCRGAGWIADDPEWCLPATQAEVDSGRAFRCSVCRTGSVSCTLCESGYVWDVTKWSRATCTECNGSGMCQTCGGDGSVFTLGELWTLLRLLFWLAVGLVLLIMLFDRSSQQGRG